MLWPLLFPGIMAGALLALVDGAGEFVASILLYTPRNVPLSIAINNELYGARFGIASVYGLIQVFLVLLAVWASRSSLFGGLLGARHAGRA